MKISNFLGVSIPTSFQDDYFKVRAYIQGFLRTQGSYPELQFDRNRNEEPEEEMAYLWGEKDAKKTMQP